MIVSAALELSTCSKYVMGTSNELCMNETWAESCLTTGTGHPAQDVNTENYATGNTVNSFWWYVRLLSIRANEGDLDAIEECYGTNKDCKCIQNSAIL